MIDKTPYTPGIREVLKLSKAEAGRLGHDYIGPEHYLLGMIRKGDGLAIRALIALGVDLANLRSRLEKKSLPGGGPMTGLFLPNTEADRVLDAAKDVAEMMKHGWVGTEHLLIALTMVQPTPASVCLAAYGVDTDKVKREVELLISIHESRDLNEVIQNAMQMAGSMGKQMSAEHVLAAMIESETKPGRFLREAGIDAKNAREKFHY